MGRWRRRLAPPAAVAVAALLGLAPVSCGINNRPGVPPPVPAAPVGEIDVTLYLIGDTGAPAPGFEPVLAALGRDLAAGAERRVVVFLGDIIYPRGMPDSIHPSRPEAERRLEAQLEVLRANRVPGIFLPGNHDWDKWGDDGWDAVRRQGRYLEEHGDGLAQFLPGGGCPGPAIGDLGETLRLVVLDTQWWLHGGPRPEDPTSDCPTDSVGEVTDSLRAAARGAGSRHVVVLAHHPLRTAGPHGGYFDWYEHIFPLRHIEPWLLIPLPIVGSAYPLARRLGISSQDLASAGYGRMRDSLHSALVEHPPLIYAAGHDHALQVIRGEAVSYVLVSGSGVYGHTDPVAWPEGWLFARGVAGYMRIDSLRSGRARLGVITVDGAGAGSEEFSMWLN